jgi:hypothetical protein
MNLSANFTLEEFLRSRQAARLGRVIEAPENIVENLRLLCANVLQPLRDYIGVPLVIWSGYRPKWLNDSTPGSSKTSDHMIGCAADIHCETLSPYRIAQAAINLRLPFKQCILEYGEWTHLSYDPTVQIPKREVLTAKVVNGKTQYIKGLEV